MRTPDRDRRRSALAALCAALVILLAAIPAAGALSADYRVFPNGTAYTASVEITDANRYEFAGVGFLGEKVAISVGNVNLSGNCSPCQFNWSKDWGRPSAITFLPGNYTVSYVAPLKDNTLQAGYDNQYNVSVILPAELDVRNPLLASISPGANVTRFADNTTLIQWNKIRTFEIRFYDQWREQLLYLFGNFWIIIAIVLLLPFLLIMKRSE
ncbi:MAG: DUF5803 family protein [Methanoregula sp.]|nr:DUF5803 family protein [Methanoregula sp.]